MNESNAHLETNTLHLQALRAAEFLYYEAARQLSEYPWNEQAAELQEITIATILSQKCHCPDHIILSNVLKAFKRREQLRQLEMEYPTFLFGTVGLDNVGKDIVSKYLRNKYGFDAHPLSDQLKDVSVMLGYHQPYGRDILHHVSSLIKSTLGDAVLIQFAESLFAKLDQPNRILFDGIRQPQEAIALIGKESAPATTAAIIAIVSGEKDEEADLIERYRRSRKRKSEKDPTKFEEFKEKSMREAPGILEAMEYASVTIVNRRHRKRETYAQLDIFMKKMGISPIKKGKQSRSDFYQTLT